MGRIKGASQTSSPRLREKAQRGTAPRARGSGGLGRNELPREGEAGPTSSFAMTRSRTASPGSQPNLNHEVHAACTPDEGGGGGKGTQVPR